MIKNDYFQLCLWNITLTCNQNNNNKDVAKEFIRTTR